ncbi:Uncharacterised protein [Mycobacteroides abscessus subsp. abscessus]|nr:Uncharacterised protein [Mycobacteroides abscessus subsp. abscessus]
MRWGGLLPPTPPVGHFSVRYGMKRVDVGQRDRLGGGEVVETQRDPDFIGARRRGGIFLKQRTRRGLSDPARLGGTGRCSNDTHALIDTCREADQPAGMGSQKHSWKPDVIYALGRRTVCRMCSMLRPRRSSFQTTTVSPSRT